jgi:HEAT repeat protein
MSDWHRLLVSGEDEALKSARQRFAVQREATIRELLKVVTSPIQNGESFWDRTTRNTAIAMLGDMRASEAVPALVEKLMPHPEQSRLDGHTTSPAERALAKIGMPAMPVLLEIVKEEGTWRGQSSRETDPTGETRAVPMPMGSRGDRCLLTLGLILGPDLLEMLLQKELAGAKSEKVRANIATALGWAQDRETKSMLKRLQTQAASW